MLPVSVGLRRPIRVGNLASSWACDCSSCAILVFVIHRNGQSQHVRLLDQIAKDMASDYDAIRTEIGDQGASAIQESGHRAESRWKEFLEDWLPPQYEIGTRKYLVSDSTGEKSSEQDLVIFHPSYPRKLRAQTLVSVSGVVAAFSVKLTLDAAGLKQAIVSAQQVRRLLAHPPRNVRGELVSTVMYGVLAHSHVWKGAGATPIANIERQLVDQGAANPREGLDVVCVADLACWQRMLFVLTEYLIDGLKQQGIEDIPHVQDVMFREADSVGKPQALGGLLSAVLGRLAVFDMTVTPIANGLRQATVPSQEAGARHRWPLAEVLSIDTLESIRNGRTGSPEWNFTYP